MFRYFKAYYNWIKFGRVKVHLTVCAIATVLFVALGFVLPSAIIICLITAFCLMYLIPIRVLIIGRSARDGRAKKK